MSIKQTLIENEAKHSLFEESLRNLPITILPNFFRDNIIRPLVFDIHEQHLPIKDSIRPYFNALNKDDVLVGSSDVLTVENKNIAVLFSGGPAAGGHNVIAGLKHALGNKNTLYGVQKGPKGLIEGQLVELSDEDIKNVINLGGFDLLGSDRTKIKSKDQFNKVKKTVTDFQLDGLIIIGGDDSNTNAAFLAEELYELGCTVVGVPKTIDGDLQVDSLLPISFGFDTATKIYSELVGNILQDTPSSQKYWHFVKLMGRSASHITLEVALQTQPHLTLISEEIYEKKWTLNELIEYMADVIIKRSKKGLNYGVVLIPEGLIEFIEDLKTLIENLNAINYQSETELNQKLAKESKDIFKTLPKLIQEQLLLDRDSHGNLKLSQIDTQLLLIEMLNDYFKSNGIDIPFNGISHFFGYEGRCGAPSAFDATFTYNLGLTAGSLVLGEHTGYMAGITSFDGTAKPLGIPLLGLLDIEKRENKDAVVIKKAIVDLESPAFKLFSERRHVWAENDSFSSPGPRQYWGPISKRLPMTTALNEGYSNLNFSFGH